MDPQVSEHPCPDFVSCVCHFPLRTSEPPGEDHREPTPQNEISTESERESVRVKWKIGMKAKDASCSCAASSCDSISNTASETLGSAGDEGAVDGPRPGVELCEKMP